MNNPAINATAVVTGAGRGIGRAMALAFAKAGAKVGLIARTPGEIEEVARAISGAGGIAHAEVADVADPEALATALANIGSTLGPIDILINNAGILGPIAPFTETSRDDWWRVVEVNLRGPMIAIHAVLPGMIARGRGRIINVATGMAPFAYFSAYATSKTALVRMSECLAAEVRPQGVAIFSLGPGTVRTAMSEHSMTSPEGRRWIPWFKGIFDGGLDLPMERPVGLALALASGRYDDLSGLTLTPYEDLDLVLRENARVAKEALYSLRLRTLPNPELARLQALREGASQALMELALEQAFTVSRDRLFDAWTDERAWAQWFIPEGGPARWIHRPVVEPRVGGAITIAVEQDGQDYRIRGSFCEVASPRALTLRWAWDEQFPFGGPGDTTVTLTFDDVPGGSRLRLLHSGFPSLTTKDAHEGGWNRCFAGLVAYFDSGRGDRKPATGTAGCPGTGG